MSGENSVTTILVEALPLIRRKRMRRTVGGGGGDATDGDDEGQRCRAARSPRRFLLADWTPGRTPPTQRRRLRLGDGRQQRPPPALPPPPSSPSSLPASSPTHSLHAHRFRRTRLTLGRCWSPPRRGCTESVAALGSSNSPPLLLLLTFRMPRSNRNFLALS